MSPDTNRVKLIAGILFVSCGLAAIGEADDQNPPKIDDITQPAGAKLEDYEGTFENRRFAVADDTVLVYERNARSKYPLVFMGDDLFRFEGYDALRFQFARDDDGLVDRVITLRFDGTSSVRQRTE